MFSKENVFNLGKNMDSESLLRKQRRPVSSTHADSEPFLQDII